MNDDNLEVEFFVDDELPADHRSGFVAVIGRPNVGKSTLMNYFLGQKVAIVSQKPQTTRNQLLGILTLPDDNYSLEDYPDIPAAQVVFVDTPGIHQPKHKLGKSLVKAAQGAIADADVLLWLVDATEPAQPEDRMVAEAIEAAQAQITKYGDPPLPVMLAVNKVDLLAPHQLESGVEQPFLALYGADEVLLLSASRGDNRDALLRWVVNTLPLGPRYYPSDQVTDQQSRFIVAELIREAALRMLHQEVPHALAVYVTEFKRRNENMTYINATIIVERQSQKGIVIGDKGRTLKAIGKKARPQIEALTETKVYLELWVKVRPKWRKDENELRRLGYAE